MISILFCLYKYKTPLIMVKEKKLLPKQKDFINECKANGGDVVLAYQKVYNVADKIDARNGSSRLMKNPLILNKINGEEELDECDVKITDNYLKTQYLRLYRTALANEDLTNARYLLKELERFKVVDKEVGEVIAIMDYSQLTSKLTNFEDSDLIDDKEEL